MPARIVRRLAAGLVAAVAALLLTAGPASACSTEGWGPGDTVMKPDGTRGTIDSSGRFIVWHIGGPVRQWNNSQRIEDAADQGATKVSGC